MNKLTCIAIFIFVIWIPTAHAEHRGEPKNEFPFVNRAVDAETHIVPPVPQPVPPVETPPPIVTPTEVTPTISVTPSPTPINSSFSVGVNFECNRIPSATVARVLPLIGGMPIRLQVFIEELNISGYLDALSACLIRNPALLVINSYTRPVDEAAYIAAVRMIASRVTGVLGVEVLNEPNYTGIAPVDYARIVRAAHAAVAGKFPVLAFVDHVNPVMWANALAPDSYEAVSTHPYADLQRAPVPSGLDRLAAVYAATGKPVWVTEIGWSLPDIEQAEQTRAAIEYLRGLNYVPFAFFYTAYPALFDGGLWDGTTLIRIGTFTPRPALAVLKSK